MTTATEDTVIQAVEIITGTLSVISCIAMARKIWMERSLHVTNAMLLSLFFIDFVLGILYAIGRSAIAVDGFCQFQGFMLQWFEVAAMLWTVLMSYLMRQWIALKRHPKRMEKTIKRGQIALFSSSFVLALILLGTNTYGNAYLWCWITSDYSWVRVIFFQLILIVSWVINMIMLQIVFASLKSRFRHTSVHGRLGDLLDSTATIQRKLILYVSAFLFIWLFALINRFVEYATGKENFVTSLLQVIFLPSQGFINALCYGDYIDMKKVLKAVDISTLFHLHHFNHNEKEFTEVMIDCNENNIHKTEPIKSYAPKKYSLFTTTLNVGEASLQSIVGDIKDWIIQGHDVYAIGVQECIDLNGLRDAILNHLGGPTKYTMYTAAIGSGNTRLGYHGYIALTVFVKTSELLAGNIHPTSTTSKTMATGTDLIITTAQNKGAVGIPLQIHDTSIGFVTCHLPSDSKGKSKLVKRNASAHAILKEVILAPEDLGFDLHLQHDHILVFGDLNYRMDTDGVGGGVNSLTGVAVACTLEKQVLNDDPSWLNRKYNLLRHSSDPLHPSIEEVKLIHQAKMNSRGAWKSVLRADELRSIMDDGDAFYGFDEPMPCFPPSYKRKKGKTEGDCGDYSTFKFIIKGYSHTGYVENILERPASQRLPAPPAESSPRERSGTLLFGGSWKSSTPPSPTTSSKRGSHIKSTNPLVTVSESNEEDEDDRVSPSSSKSNPTIDPVQLNASSEDEGIRESEDRPSDPDDSIDEGASARVGRRRKAMLNKEAVAGMQKEESVYETDPSKLRPPSYTDRILMHSLPDRTSRVTVQAYDFCDTLRVSDHRAVSMTILLEVNSNVIYQGAAENSNVINEHPEHISKEPKFEVYELLITNLSVTMLDLKVEEEEEEFFQNNANESAEGTSDKITPVNSGDGEDEIKHVSIKRADNFEESNPMFKKKVYDIQNNNNTTSNNTNNNSSNSSSGNNSNRNSHNPLHDSTGSQDSNNSPKKKKKVGVKFSGDENGGHDIEMQALDTKGLRFDSNTTENSNTSNTSESPLHGRDVITDESVNSPSRPTSAAISDNDTASSRVSSSRLSEKSSRKKSFWGFSSHHEGESKDIEAGEGVVVVAGDRSSRRKASGRKRSMFAVFFSPNHHHTDEEKEDEKERKTEVEDEDAILRDMARESLDWKNTLHQPGEWRKKVLEEQRREREKEKNSLAIKKKHKSDEKMIHMLTVVFPLPSKDPLLVYRRMYDYSQAFDIEDKSQKAFGKHE